MDTEFLVVHKTEEMDAEQSMNSSEMEAGVEIVEQEQDMVEVDHKRNGLQTVFAKFMEEKHSITYRKLVVPQSMRSIYWKFFGFPADDDGEILTRVKIVCLLCKTQIAYNRNTSNLRMHLQNKHVQELHELEALSPPRKPVITPESKERRAQKRMLKAAMASSSQHIYTTNADGTVHIGGDIQFVTDPSVAFPEQCMEEDMTVNISKPLKFVIKDGTIDNVSTTSNQNMTFMLSEDQQQQQQQQQLQQSSSNNKSVSEAIVEFLIIDLQLPEIVQEQGFQRLIATLKSPCQIPSKNSLEEEIIPTTYNTFRETILSNISSLTSEVSLAVEEWISNFGESFFSFLIYYQSPDEAVLESKILCTIHGPREWTELQWGTILDTMINDWCIKLEKTTAVIASTTRLQLKNAFISRGLTVVPCLLHSLQICAQTIFENYEVSKVLNNCRAIIGAIASNAEATNTFAMQEQLLGLEENMMVMDYPNVWTSTYTMLQQMIPRREVITMVLSNIDGIDQIDQIDLNDEQWQIVNDLVDVLEPFKVTIMTLSEEKMPLISLLKPLLWQLVSAHLKVKEEDSVTARAFKETLSDMLCHHYSDPNVNLLLQIATTLDPRFKEVPYATDEDKKMVATPLKEMLTKLIEENEDASEGQKDCEQIAKKSRLSGMELLLGGLRPNKRGMTAEEKANLELAQYQSEATAPLDNCPLQWWAKVSAKCPNLGSIASRYNCVPVCCPQPSRIPADVQMAYNAKRAALPPHLVDKMLFLHANHNLV